jgi:hypothetical protein
MSWTGFRSSRPRRKAVEVLSGMAATLPGANAPAVRITAAAICRGKRRIFILLE